VTTVDADGGTMSWKRTALAGLGLATIALLAARWYGDRAPDRMTVDLRDREVAWLSGDFTRPSPHGQVEPGNAWPHLLRAVELAHGPDATGEAWWAREIDQRLL